MTAMGSMSENDFEEVTNGIRAWLKRRQNQALFSENTACETIQELLEDLKKSSKGNLFPWEM